jgi:hypothetical protein
VATRKTTRKNNVRGKGTSSSSGRTATSRTPADVLELGKYIVRELQLNDRGDWLRHWLAHHVAELIRDAENAKDDEARREAAKLATETILKIWDHRFNLPGDVNPLARYREALQALLELRPNPDRWPTLDDLAARGVVGNIYRRFPKLMRALVILPSVRAQNRDRVTSKAVRKFLQKDENRLLNMFEVRLRILGEKDDGETASKPKNDYLEFEEAANKLIDDTIADLHSIRVGGKAGRQAKRSRVPRE